MTGTEFSRWLATASQQEKETLKRRAGAGGLQDAQCLDSFIAEPSCKARFHAAMGEPTEEEKLARDTLWFARWGFWLVAISVVVAVLSLIVTVAIFLKQERSARERSAAEVVERRHQLLAALRQTVAYNDEILFDYGSELKRRGSIVQGVWI